MRTLVELNELLDTVADPAWAFTEPGFDPAKGKQAESRLATSNGFLGVRGDVTTDEARQRCYVAGHFRNDGPAGVPVLSPAPLPFPLDVAIDGVPLGLGRGQLLDYAASLDLKH